MLTRSRVAVAIAAAVSVVVLAGVSSHAQNGTPTTSCGGCLPPSLGVDIYSLFLPFSLGNSETREADCAKLCRKWTNTCNGVAKIAKKCNNPTSGKFAALFGSICDTLSSGDDRKACKRDVKAAREVFKGCVKEDAKRGEACCARIGGADCFARCTETSFDRFAPCFTGSGPEGDNCFFEFFGAP
jgi:hypothetical protein